MNHADTNDLIRSIRYALGTAEMEYTKFTDDVLELIRRTELLQKRLNYIDQNRTDPVAIRFAIEAADQYIEELP